MKKFKKLYFLLLLISCQILLIACASSSNSDKKSATNIINKTIENFKNTSSYETFTSGSGYSVPKQDSIAYSKDYIIETALTKEPLAYKMKDKSNNLSSQYVYLSGVEYSKKTTSEESPDWEAKANDTISADTFINVFHLRNILEYNKDYTLTENDTSYTIEFKPQNLDEFKYTYYSSANDEVKNKSQLEYYFIKINIDKNTLLPTSEEIEYKKNEYSDTSKEYINSYFKERKEYKNYNFVAPISFPSEKESL